MKKELLLIVFILFFIKTSNAQIGIGTTSPTSTLDVVASNPTGTSTNIDGILIPRVTRQRAQSMVSVPTSTIIYVNDVVSGTAAGLTVNVTSVGFYFFNGSIWEKISTGLNTDWSLTGNAGTVPGTNFLGTTTPADLRIKTNSIDRWNFSNTNAGQLQSYSLGTAAVPMYSFQSDSDTGMYSSGADALAFSTFGTQRMIIGANGNVGINCIPSYKLEVSSVTGDAIFGHSNNVGGVLGYESNFSFGTPVQSLLGTGVYANNPAAGYTSIFAQSTGAATVAANISYSNVWMANYNYVDNSSPIYNPNVSYNQLNVTNATLGGTQIALRGWNERGTTAGNPGYSVGVQGISDAQNQDAMGIQGLAFTNGTIRVGGYFEGLNYAGTSHAYAYVGGTINSGTTARKIVGTGSVSEIIPTENHGRITLTCPESPEYWYQDYGTVEMINGKATIQLDPILADIIVVDEENPIRVICTPVGMPYFNGVTIMSQTSNSVEILELNGGTHSGKLQYQLVTKPKTNYGEGRFPQAPGPSYLKADKEPLAAKAKNQPNDGRKVFKWKSDSEVYKYNPEDFVSIGDVIPSGPNAGKIKLGNGKYSVGVPAEKPKQ